MSADPLAAYGLEPSVPTTVAAAALGVTPKTIVNWIEAGTIAGGKIGDRWIVLLSALRQLQQDMRDMKWGPNRSNEQSARGRRKASDQRTTAKVASDRLARALGKPTKPGEQASAPDRVDTAEENE